MAITSAACSSLKFHAAIWKCMAMARNAASSAAAAIDGLQKKKKKRKKKHACVY